MNALGKEGHEALRPCVSSVFLQPLSGVRLTWRRKHPQKGSILIQLRSGYALYVVLHRAHGVTLSMQVRHALSAINHTFKIEDVHTELRKLQNCVHTYRLHRD